MIGWFNDLRGIEAFIVAYLGFVFCLVSFAVLWNVFETIFGIHKN